MDPKIVTMYRVKKYTKILAIFLLFLLIGLMIYEYIRVKPNNVHFTNISSSSVTVSWNTNSPTPGYAKVVSTKSVLPVSLFSIGSTLGYDTRDIKQAELEATAKTAENIYDNESGVISISDIETEIKINEAGKYYTHHVELKNLDPETEYSIRVGDGLMFTKAIDTEEVETVKTLVISDTVLTPVPAYGSVKDSENQLISADQMVPVNDSVVFLRLIDQETLETTSYMSSTTNQDGNWYLDLAYLISSSGEDFLNKDFKSLTVELYIDGGPLGYWKTTNTSGEIAPFPISVFNLPNDAENNGVPGSLIRLRSYNISSNLLGKVFAKSLDADQNGDGVVTPAEEDNYDAAEEESGTKDCLGQPTFTKKDSNGNNLTCYRECNYLTGKWINQGCETDTPPVTPGTDDPPIYKSCAFSGYCKCVGVVDSGRGYDVYTPQPVDCSQCDQGTKDAYNSTQCKTSSDGELNQKSAEHACGTKPNDDKCYECQVSDANQPAHYYLYGGNWVENQCPPPAGDPNLAQDIANCSTKKTAKCPVWFWNYNTNYCDCENGIVPEEDGTDIIDEKTCNETEGRIWNNGSCGWTNGIPNLPGPCAELGGEWIDNPGTDKDGCDTSNMDLEQRKMYLCLLEGNSWINGACDSSGSSISNEFECKENYGDHLFRVNDDRTTQTCINGKWVYDRGWFSTGLDECENLVKSKQQNCTNNSDYCYNGYTDVTYVCDNNQWVESTYVVDDEVEIEPTEPLEYGSPCSNRDCSCPNGDIVNTGEWCPELSFYSCNEKTVGKVCSYSGERCEVEITTTQTGQSKTTYKDYNCTLEPRSSLYTPSTNIFSVKKLFAQESQYIVDVNTGLVSGIEPGVYSFEYDGITYTFGITDDNLESNFGYILLFIDLNQNGVFDEGTDTKVSDLATQITLKTIELKYEYNLKEGLNFVSLPFIHSEESLRTAAGLLQYLNETYSDSIYSISKYDGNWKIVGENIEVYDNNDFQLLPGQGYVIKSKQNISISIWGNPVQFETGEDSAAVTIYEGWNLIGLYGSNIKQYTAHSLIKEINSYEPVDFTADNVSKWEADKQKYEGYQLTVENGSEMAYGFDYQLNTLQGYFVRITLGNGNWQPSLK